MGESIQLSRNLDHNLTVISPCLLSCSENRYLLFLTENYAALEILNHYLRDVVGTASADPVETRPEDMHPFILFGSSFPKDKEYTQVMVYISRRTVSLEGCKFGSFAYKCQFQCCPN